VEDATKQFGYLTVLAIDGRKCRCRCKCGREVYRNWYHVKSGRVKSCGCLRSESVKRCFTKPISVGETFGRLTVVSYHGKTCKCRCQCGNLVTVKSTRLRTGHTQSCGCYQKDQARRSSLKVIEPGTIFNYLTVIKQEGDVCTCSCKCDGKLLTVETKKLRSGHVKSCGCLRVEHAISMSQDKMLPSGEVAFNSLLGQYKAQASARQLIFDLSPDEFRTLTSKCCAYCGCSPANIKRNPGSVGSYVYNGIDRRDNKAGYTVENSVTCCWTCNNAKALRTEEEFLTWVKLISDSNQNRELRGALLEVNSAWSLLLRRYKNTAKRKKIDWCLDDSNFFALASSPCSYCGRPPHRELSYGPNSILYTGVDRTDNAVGYTIENSTSCCWDCNNAKSIGSAEDFMAWASRVVKHVYG
jgi:hypothetical protein